MWSPDKSRCSGTKSDDLMIEMSLDNGTPKTDSPQLNKRTSISDPAKISNVFFLIYTIHVLCSTLAMLGLSDPQLVLFKRMPLPLFGFRLGVDIFFMAVPFMAVLFFLCFHAFALRPPGHGSWKMRNPRDSAAPLSSRVIPSSGPVEKRSWFPGLCSSAGGLRPRILRSFVMGVFSFVFYGSLPAFLIFTAFSYLKRHEPAGSYVLAASVFVGVAAVIWMRHIHRVDLGEKTKSFPAGLFCLIPVFLACEILLLGFLIPWTRTGVAPRKYKFNLERFFRPLIYVSLSSLDLSALKADDANLDLRSFKKVHLGGAVLNGAVLRGLDLGRIYLRGAKMRFVEAEGANLSFADMRETDLFGGDFRNGVFLHADFVGSYVIDADFRSANLNNANLRYATFYLCDMRGADLSHCDFRLGSQIFVNFEKADLTDCNFQGITMTQTDFSGADLTDSDLREADLSRAVFSGALLKGADLTGALNLTPEQLSRAKTLYGARLDPKLRRLVSDKYPFLLEKPEAGK